MAVKEISVKVGKRIKYFRGLKKLSQETLAFSAGLNTAFLGHIERGMKCPTVDTLNKIAAALNVTLSELLDFGDESMCLKQTDDAMKRINMSIRDLSRHDADAIAEIVEDIVKIKNNPDQ